MNFICNFCFFTLSLLSIFPWKIHVLVVVKRDSTEQEKEEDLFLEGNQRREQQGMKRKNESSYKQEMKEKDKIMKTWISEKKMSMTRNMT